MIFLEAAARAGRLEAEGFGGGDGSDAMKESSSPEGALVFNGLAVDPFTFGRDLLLLSDGMVSKKSSIEDATLVFFVGLMYSASLSSLSPISGTIL